MKINNQKEFQADMVHFCNQIEGCRLTKQCFKKELIYFKKFINNDSLFVTSNKQNTRGDQKKVVVQSGRWS